MLRSAPHTLDAKGEKILAHLLAHAGQRDKRYRIFANSDMPWPTVKLSTGKEVKLEPARATRSTARLPTATTARRSWTRSSARGRNSSARSGTLLYSHLKEDTVYAKVRKYPDSITRSLDANNLPRCGLRRAHQERQREPADAASLLQAARARCSACHGLHYYDIYPPLVHGDRKFPLDEGTR